MLASVLYHFANCSHGYVSAGGGTAVIDGSASSYNQAIGSCRRIFSFVAKRRLGSIRGEGILLYVKPDFYRLEVWDDMGNLIFHYVENNEEFEIMSLDDYEDVFSMIDPDEEDNQGTGFTLEEIKSIGLCLFEVEGGAEYIQDDGIMVTTLLPLDRDTTIERRFTFEKSSGMPSRFLVVKNGKKLREAVFENVEKSSGISRPHKVKIIDHVLSTTVTLSVVQESINTAIPVELFSINGNTWSNGE